MQARLLLDAQCKLAEGPVWHEGAFWWTDIEGKAIHRLDGEQHDHWAMPTRVGTFVPTDRGRWIVACDDGLFFWSPGEERALIADPQTGGTRFNDGKAGPNGHLYAGTMALEKNVRGAFYRLDPGGNATELFGDVRTSNGLAWSKDGRTLWYVDTPTGRVDALDHDLATGDVANRRPAVEGFPGHPDGLCIDDDETLWVGQWGGSCIVRCDPRTGEHLSRVELPVPNVTSCCFGGASMRSLYITTAKSDEAGSGGIWVVDDAGVGGPAVDRYRE